FFFFFFQAEDGIRDKLVTGVQTCALPIWIRARVRPPSPAPTIVTRVVMLVSLSAGPALLGYSVRSNGATIALLRTVSAVARREPDGRRSHSGLEPAGAGRERPRTLTHPGRDHRRRHRDRRRRGHRGA